MFNLFFLFPSHPLSFLQSCLSAARPVSRASGPEGFMAWWQHGLAAPAKGVVLLWNQHSNALWSRYSPWSVLGHDAFPGIQAGNGKSWGLSEMLAFICSGAKRLLLLSASLHAAGLQNQAREKKKEGYAVVWGSWAPVTCSFVCFLSFLWLLCFHSFQTAGSVSFIRLIDDGQHGFMENITCLNSWILLRSLILMRQNEIHGIAVSNTASPVIGFFRLGPTHCASVSWNPRGTQPVDLKLGRSSAALSVWGSSVLHHEDGPCAAKHGKDAESLLPTICWWHKEYWQGLTRGGHISWVLLSTWVWFWSPLSAGS